METQEAKLLQDEKMRLSKLVVGSVPLDSGVVIGSSKHPKRNRKHSSRVWKSQLKQGGVRGPEILYLDIKASRGRSGIRKSGLEHMSAFDRNFGSD